MTRQPRPLCFISSSLPSAPVAPPRCCPRGKANRALAVPWIALSPSLDTAFRFHQVAENIVDAGQVAFALGAQPIEHFRVEPDTYRNLAPCLAWAHQSGKLFFGQPGNILEFPSGKSSPAARASFARRIACFSASVQCLFLISSVFILACRPDER